MPFKKNVDHTIHESRDFTTVYLVITHMMMTFGQKLSASAILPSDEIISSEKQIRLAVEIVLNYIRPESK